MIFMLGYKQMKNVEISIISIFLSMRSFMLQKLLQKGFQTLRVLVFQTFRIFENTIIDSIQASMVTAKIGKTI